MIGARIDDREVVRALSRLAVKVKDLSPAMREISGVMAGAVEENFLSGGRPKWRELAPATIAQRRRRGTWPGQILIRSAGGLAASIEASHSAVSARAGTNKPYGPIHQFGGKAGRGRKVKIPARPYLALGENDKEEILQVMKRYLREAVK